MKRALPRIGLLTASASRLNGGVFEAVVAHAAMLRARGFAPHVLAPDDAHGAEDAARFGDVPVTRLPVKGPRAIGYAPALVDTLVAADLDIVHLHGIWMAPSAAGAAWAARTGRPYVISPHGMLDPWITGRGRAKKWLARHGYERRSWARAALFHALTPAEADDIENETGGDAIAVVPNAVDLHDRAPPSADRFLLYIGRIHPKKNLSALIAAWSQPEVRRADPAARLVIAGWGEPDHVAQLEADIARSPDAGVSFIGPVYGAQKAALLGSARFVVLPSLSEGLPVAVLEAWGSGTPALISPACHLPQGFAAGAAIDSGTTPATIAAACRVALSMNEAAWHAMSAAAHDLARAAFSTAYVGDRWSAIYGDLLGRR